ncbi:uncharacterized protein TNCV_1340031 [Trichonephila clavipes]|uniref:Uncharacterized protein n=1 Tax=Trichonephila clavipes TaxID=2585209 RepID=A0A8X6RBW0_TRICX|nr:uncharacterized protein TNCV_1340031 [Trichonephila clavipes]
MFDSSSYDNPTHLARVDTSRDVLPRGEPIFEEETLTLYGKDIDKVELHKHKTSNHMSKLTVAFLAKEESETGIKCNIFVEICSIYASPMDFSAFGLFKRASGKLHPITLNELWKTVQEEWIKKWAYRTTKKKFTFMKNSS